MCNLGSSKGDSRKIPRSPSVQTPPTLSITFEFLILPSLDLHFTLTFNSQLSKIRESDSKYTSHFFKSSLLFSDRSKYKDSRLCHSGQGLTCDQSQSIISHRQGSNNNFVQFPKSAIFSFLNHPQGPLHLCGFKLIC